LLALPFPSLLEPITAHIIGLTLGFNASAGRG
jgi:hypothetical protein